MNKESKTTEQQCNKQNVKHHFSLNYKREKHPLIIRLVALYRVITCRNFILIDFEEITKRTLPARRVRPLYRSDYDSESEILTLKAALYMKSQNGA